MACSMKTGGPQAHLLVDWFTAAVMAEKRQASCSSARPPARRFGPRGGRELPDKQTNPSRVGMP